MSRVNISSSNTKKKARAMTNSRMHREGRLYSPRTRDSSARAKFPEMVGHKSDARDWLLGDLTSDSPMAFSTLWSGISARLTAHGLRKDMPHVYCMGYCIFYMGGYTAGTLFVPGYLKTVLDVMLKSVSELIAVGWPKIYNQRK
ncbi:hypothetical protein BJX64DRAFT_204991 [Aspergillus heterothallicus]